MWKKVGDAQQNVTLIILFCYENFSVILRLEDKEEERQK